MVLGALLATTGVVPFVASAAVVITSVIQTGSLPRFAALLVVLLSGLLIAIGVYLAYLGRRQRTDVSSVSLSDIGVEEYAGFRCVRCGHDKLLRLPYDLPGRVLGVCESCKCAYPVTGEVHEQLPEWDAGSPLDDFQLFMSPTVQRIPRWLNLLALALALTTVLGGMVLAGCLVLWDLPMWLAMPVALVAAVAGLVLPGAVVGSRPRQSSVSSCESCGYDLRGCVQFRCPECGRPFVDRICRPWGESQ